MKTFRLIPILLILCISVSGNNPASTSADKTSGARTELNYSDIEKTVITFRVDGFSKKAVTTPNGTEYIIALEDATQLLEKGSPDLAKLSNSIIIPDKARMDLKVVRSSFTDYTGIPVAPSKGNLYRDTDPATVPYEYGEAYQQDAFYPGKLAALEDPYILRDYRGQVVKVYPYQYNPVTKTLRVYDEIKVEITNSGEPGANTLKRDKAPKKMVREFRGIYQRHFINADAGITRYTPVDDHGNMLIISYGDFMDEIEPLADWKTTTGMPVEVVDVATIGGSSQIKSYIANYYNTNGLTFVLLVGDAAQVPTSFSNGDSDNDYSYVVGNDHYPDLFVGRFSAETETQVETQVTRTIEYEKDPDLDFDWFTRAIGIASDQGPGHMGEYDYEHIRNIHDDLLDFTYTYAAELFDGSQGGNDDPGNPTPSMVAEEVNTGSTIINYTGHGSTTSWGTSGFSNGDVNNLVNEHMWPFIWSVACVNGNFVGNTCFAEAWLRATNNGNPTGAVATLMSTINQSWDPPMCGQDEMVDILVETYPDNIKRTFGGLSMHGCMKMNDEFGSAGDEMTDTWTCFGDPSVMVRTAFPQIMNATYSNNIFIGMSSFTVTSDAEGGLVCLTQDGEIFSTAFIENGSATLTFPELTAPGILDLAITGFNFLPVLDEIEVIPANIPYVLYESHDIIDTAGNNNNYLDFGETVGLSLEMENMGGVDAMNVDVIIRTTDEYTTIYDSTENYGDIPAGQSVTVPGGFTIHVADNVPDEHEILFDVIATDENDSSWISFCPVEAYAPILAINEMIIDDSQTGNGNGRLDPGETAVIKIKNRNLGHCPAENCIGTLYTECHYLTFDNTVDSIGNMGLIGFKYSEYTVHVDPEAPNGSIIAEFDYELISGGFLEEKSFSQKIGLIFEDFETGDFSKFDWEMDGDEDWIISSVFPYEGIYSARSGAIDGSQTSELKITLEVMTADSIYFVRKVSSHNGDKLKFYINNTLKGEWSGTTQGWKNEAFPVNPGWRTFRWVYQKDAQGVAGSDCAWLDWIIMPPLMALTCYAGPDDVNCGTTPYQCSGEATDWQTIEWSSTGTGTFDDPTLIDPVYTPSTEDVASGMVELIITATDNEGSTVDDEMILEFIDVPPTPAQPEGPEYVDVLVNPVTEYTISDVEFAESYEWLLEPEEAGTVSGDGTIATVEWSNAYLGTAQLAVKAFNICGASEYSEALDITIDNTVSLAEMSSEWGIHAYPNPTNGNFQVAVNGKSDKTLHLKIFNAVGMEIYSRSIEISSGEHHQDINLKDLSEGMYFLLLEGENVAITKKIIINK
ncbi:MAG: C25 family cysteine peptidase [Bacteroidales bacterium]